MNCKTVEFVGLPCSGKTSLLNLIEEEVVAFSKVYKTTRKSVKEKSYNKKVIFPIKRYSFKTILDFLVFILTNLRIPINLLRYTLKWKPFHFENIIVCIKTLMLVYSIQQKLNCSKSSYVFFDQGIIQGIWSIGINSNIAPSKIYLEKLINSIIDIIPNYIIFIDTNIETVLNRLEKRKDGTSRFDNWEKEKSKQILRIHKKTLKFILSCVKGKEIIEIKGEKPFEENIFIIKKFLSLNN